MIRDTVQITGEKTDAFNIINTYGSQHFNVYLKHISDVYIDVTHYPSQANVFIDKGPWPANSGEPQLPNGYGTPAAASTVDIIRHVNFSNVAINQGEFRPVGNFVGPSPNIGGVETRSYIQANWNTSADTALTDPDPDLDTYTRNFPVMNIGYVVILSPPNDVF